MMNLLDEAPIVPCLELPRLGAAQRHRLQQLSLRANDTVVWDGVTAVSHANALVVILEPACAARVETLIQSLDRSSIVALPYGENPTFDPIKLKLAPHGLIGAEGADAPHQLWWGGVAPLAPSTGIYRCDATLMLSCYARGTVTEQTVARFHAHLDLLGLDSVIEEFPSDLGLRMRGTDKIDCIIRHLKNARSVFWIDPAAIVRRHPVLPQSLACDVAFVSRSRGEIETRALYFRPTVTAHALLEVWHRLSMAYPDLPEGFLFDQAWVLTCAQRSIETAWLPQSYGGSDPAVQDVAIALAASDCSRDAIAAEGAYPAIGRRFGRAHAPEPHLIMPGSGWRHRPIVVMINDVQHASAEAVGAATESVAFAFEADTGGFCRMEIVLCGSDHDVASVMALELESWVVLVGPDERWAPDAFAQFGRAVEAISRIEPHPGGSAAPDLPRSVISLSDPGFGFAAGRGGLRAGVLLRRPMPA